MSLDTTDERAHLATCDECQAETEQFRRTAGLLGATEAEPPPMRLHSSVVAKWSAPPPKETTIKSISIPVAGASGSQATTTTAAAAPTTTAATATTAKP